MLRFDSKPTDDAASRLLRAYATQMDTLRRLRTGGSQFVRVEHVHMNEGGQAFTVSVRPRQGGEDCAGSTNNFPAGVVALWRI